MLPNAYGLTDTYLITVIQYTTYWRRTTLFLVKGYETRPFKSNLKGIAVVSRTPLTRILPKEARSGLTAAIFTSYVARIFLVELAVHIFISGTSATPSLHYALEFQAMSFVGS